MPRSTPPPSNKPIIDTPISDELAPEWNTTYKPLTPKQSRFVSYYIGKVELEPGQKATKGNATQSAIAAGCTEVSAGMMGCDYLTKPNIRAAIQNFMDMVAKSQQVYFEGIVREHQAIATADPGDYMDEDGNLKPLKDLTRDQRAAIAEITVEPCFEGKGDSREMTGYKRKYKLWCKQKSLLELTKLKTTFKDELLVKKIVTGKDGGPVEVEVSIKDLPLEDLARIYQDKVRGGG